MTTVQQFDLPDVGEGLTEAEIVTWHVVVGDIVAVNQVIVEIETAKSIVELPCPYAGQVVELFAEAGQVVEVGRPIIGVDTAGSAMATPARDVLGGPQAAAESGEKNAASASAVADHHEPKLLVGYGARESGTRPRRGRGHVVAHARASGAPATLPPAAPTAAPDTPARHVAHGPVRTKPPVRKMAKVLGVDLSRLVPSGPNQTITRADVEAAHQALSATTRTPVDDQRLLPLDAAEEERIPIKGMRKHTAAAMVASAFTAPHVTEFVTVDITRTMDLREQVQRRREFRDTKLSPLVFVARAYLLALSRTPMANARWDEGAQEIVVRRRVNLGIAAATPRGLVVPNVKGAHDLTLAQLATAINELAQAARAGKTTPEAMSQGTTTITNVGVFGVDSGTPILNPGETAILAVGAVRRMPWVVEDRAGERVEPRWVTQLALSFDHRVMDGQQGSELLADTAAVLLEPGMGLL